MAYFADNGHYLSVLIIEMALKMFPIPNGFRTQNTSIVIVPN